MIEQDNSNGSSRDHLGRVIKMVIVISQTKKRRRARLGLVDLNSSRKKEIQLEIENGVLN